MVSRLEALFDGLSSVKGWSNPDSISYQLRNPILVQSFSRPGKNTIDSDGRRIFDTQLAGIRAGLFDLELKVRGESRAGIKKDDTLENLLRVYGLVEKLGQQQVVKFLKRALKTQEVSVTTPLAWFLQETN